MKFASFVTAALLLAASAAHAATDLSSVAQKLDVTAGRNNSVSLGHTFVATPEFTVAAGDFFNDRYNLDLLGAAPFVNINITSNSVDLTGFSLYTSRDELVFSATQKLIGDTEKYTIKLKELDAGNYYFLVSGTLLSAGGSFAGNGVLEISQALAPVPEPTTWAMLLGGLSMLAFAARRKSK